MCILTTLEARGRWPATALEVHIFHQTLVSKINISTFLEARDDPLLPWRAVSEISPDSGLKKCVFGHFWKRAGDRQMKSPMREGVRTLVASTSNAWALYPTVLRRSTTPAPLSPKFPKFPLSLPNFPEFPRISPNFPDFP